ncbi:hypothetical protein CLAIMM_03637 [Cladophialophora immunda]|nr:hypothetical protein CLAIMM_03637 [Cladophialophora immunda]
MSLQKNEVETGIAHVENKEPSAGSYTIGGFQTHEEALPKGYSYNYRTIGTFVAGVLSAICGIGGFSFAAPLLGTINTALGPTVDIDWVAIVFNLTGAVSMPICGRAMDIFGRRWIVVCLAGVALVGAIVNASAQNIPSLIVGTALMGLAAPAQTCYNVILGELVPMKHRYTMGGLIFVFAGIPTAFSAAIAQGIAENTNAGWRGVYYMVVAFNAVSFCGYLVCYHPPTFEMKHGRERKVQYLKQFDFGGSALFISGLSLLLMGLLWGGSRYPWHSAAVISTIVICRVCLICFWVYEALVPLKEPLMPHRLFNKEWLAAVTCLGFAASAFYGFSIIWPQMVANMYSTNSTTINGVTSSIPGLGMGCGGMIGSVLAKGLKRTKIIMVASFLVGGTLLACMATCTPDTRGRAIALLFCGASCLGHVEVIGIAMATLLVKDQRDIGIAGQLGISFRTAISVVGTAIYTAVLSTRLGKTIPDQVPKALAAAGLPQDDIPLFISALSSGTSLSDVPGTTPKIIAVGTRAYQLASADAYRTVFYTTIAFSLLGAIASLWVPDSYQLMTGDIAARLNINSDDQPEEAVNHDNKPSQDDEQTGCS